MKTTVLQKHLLLGMLFFAATAEMKADNCCPTSSCATSCCDSDNCGSPLNCGCFNIQVQAGVAPVIWSKRDCFELVSCNAASLTCNGNTPIGPVIPVFELPKFSRLFRVPWTVGGKIGYALSDRTEVYIEANYRQSRAKHCFTANPDINLGLFVAEPTFQINVNSKYRFYDVFLGARYYGDRCWICDRLAWFVGIQFGLVHHKEVKASITTSSRSNTCAPAFTTDCFNFFHRHTSPAAGANIGLDYCICGGLSLVLTAEFIATCGPTGGQVCFAGCDADVVLPELRPTNFIVGDIQTEVYFPVTLGLKYSF
jgi:hypothetical protein